MDKRKIAEIGFEIVAYSGDARSKFLKAIKNLKSGGDLEESKKLVEQGNQLLIKAHNSQTEILALESSGEDLELGFIFVHGQDHLMTTILLKDIIDYLFDIYK